jgi:hypothetical protein
MTFQRLRKLRVFSGTLNLSARQSMPIKLRISIGVISRSRSWMQPYVMSLIASIATRFPTIGVKRNEPPLMEPNMS